MCAGKRSMASEGPEMTTRMLDGARKHRRAIALACYLALAAAAYTVAFLLRFDGRMPPAQELTWQLTLPLAVLLKGMAAYYFGLVKGIWRYTGMPDLVRILKAASVSSVALLFAVVMLYARWVPRSVLVMDYVITIAFFAGVRIAWRIFYENRLLSATVGAGRPTLIVGAGDSGELALRMLMKSSAGDLGVVGFLDDDPHKRGLTIGAHHILGAVAEAPRIVSELGVRDIVIAVPGAGKQFVRDLVERCSSRKVRFHILRPPQDVQRAEAEAQRIRAVEVEDLLGRDPVQLDNSTVTENLRGKSVIVTGAGGSIGSELARQIATYEPGRLVLMDTAESALFSIEQELRRSAPNVLIHPVLGDIKGADTVSAVFEAFKPERIYHAAAYKHVPMLEDYPAEAVLNNVFGTRNLAEAAIQCGVERFVMISTDKAVRPSSVMGATKRCAELLLLRLMGRGVKFVAVRFGNVLGSNGSVVPIFREQIVRGGPITVTHPDMTRYFMTIPEAVRLVLQAGAIGEGGEVFVLEMGKPIRIVDLARNMIELAGLEVGRDIQIEFTGMRPGEKLYEELIAHGEETQPTSIPKVMAHLPDHSKGYDGDFANDLAALEARALARDNAAARHALWEIVHRHDPDVPPQGEDMTGAPAPVQPEGV